MFNPAPIDAQQASRTSDGEGSWEALLRMTPLDHSQQRSARIEGKRVLITGAGGSIGSALALAVHASAPSSLVLLDTSESGLYEVDRSLRGAGSQQHAPLLGSVCDGPTLDHLFEEHKPQIIFHAAALKQVPLMEQNPFAAISNNALGTHTLVQTATDHSAESLVLVSTDKAVDPHSIMGASKRIAELIFLTHSPSPMRLLVVRLCNVIGSQGSVLPLLLDQLAHNISLTITHPDAERYFITHDRAVHCILTALASDANSQLLIPDVGAPLRIVGLAEYLLHSRASMGSITFMGLRPGDKLSEQLFSERERVVPHTDDAAFLSSIASPAPARSLLESALADLREAIRAHDLSGLLRAVHTVVPEYEPSSLLKGALTRSTAGELVVETHA